MSRRWMAGALVLGIVTVALGAANEKLPVLKTFHLTYSTLPLDEGGEVNRAVPPTRYFYKGHRSRIDNFMVEGGQPILMTSSILDCDSSRMIQVNWREKQYTLMTFAEWKQQMERMMEMGRQAVAQYGGQMPGQPEARPGSTGGLVTHTTTWKDTTDTRTWFGLPARYVEKTETTRASAEACYAVDVRSEDRYWVTDLDLPLCLPPFEFDGTGFADGRPADGGCTDRTESKVIGRPKPLGFILRHEATHIVDGRRTSSGFEVVELSRDTLADSLFAPPAGFERVSTENLFAAAGGGAAGDPAAEPVPPKAAGTIRIGVALVLPAGAPAARPELIQDVIRWIEGQARYDAVGLAATDRTAALAEAPTKQADYVLFYDVGRAEMKVSKKGVLGGMVGGALGQRAAGGATKLEVEGDYVLLDLEGETLSDDRIESEESADDPQAALSGLLVTAAEEALAALR